MRLRNNFVYPLLRCSFAPTVTHGRYHEFWILLVDNAEAIAIIQLKIRVKCSHSLQCSKRI